MKLFFEYLYSFRRVAAVWLLFLAVAAGVFYLYDVSLEPILYTALICAAVGLIAILVRFVLYRRRSLLLRDIEANLPLMTDLLPPALDPEEKALCAIISRLGEISKRNIAALSAERRDSLEYYTVWLHQIKTPIAAMRMILQSEDTETNRELSAELFRIEEYAQMALNYLRLDSPTSDLVIREFPLDRVVKQAIHSYAPLFIRRKIRLVYHETDAAVVSDEKWLLFLIEQLLSNAIKYTNHGSVTIAFGEDRVLTIADTGIGIAAEDLPRIFEKGFTGLSGRKERKSTGLGLYLCKRTADKLGHRLSVSSRVGEGTTVSIDLSSVKLDIE
ncbi:MAG: sensor histidine kinase [Bacteroides sp.]|nr:sensor histidine kinase [Eubacterium sp.]MCM1418635.1 sensor histidine kinase [Roseburia sp.]MCM1462689.1 sensor histidine kinase [Bacteroides sp.]